MGSATEACSSTKEKMFIFGLLFSQGILKADGCVTPLRFQFCTIHLECGAGHWYKLMTNSTDYSSISYISDKNKITICFYKWVKNTE